MDRHIQQSRSRLLEGVFWEPGLSIVGCMCETLFLNQITGDSRRVGFYFDFDFDISFAGKTPGIYLDIFG